MNTRSDHGNRSDRSSKPDATEVLAMLTAGNHRFVLDQAIHPRSCPIRRQLAHSSSQAAHALATVLACSDSRVPVERIFDMGVMDLFVVRVAGNVVDRAAAASLEYGMLHVHTPLLVVLGHTDCGAVTAAINQIKDNKHPEEDNICGLLTAIKPAVERVLRSGPEQELEQLVTRAVEENIWQGIGDLLAVSPAIRELITSGLCSVVAGIYRLATGDVVWLDPPVQAAGDQEFQGDSYMAELGLPVNLTRSDLMAEARVLIVDDEVEFLEGMGERLKNRDFLVDMATSGLEALDKLAINGYDAIVLDLMMPGLDGLETLKRALKKNPDLQIILLTGQASVKIGVEAMREGALDFMEKPANMDALADKIREGRTRRLKLDEKRRMAAVRDALTTRGW